MSKRTKAKEGIELNGVSNLKQLLFSHVEDYDDGTHGFDAETMCLFHKQLDNLERYMLAYDKAVVEGKPVPIWHEVLKDPSAYPTRKEKQKV